MNVDDYGLIIRHYQPLLTMLMMMAMLMTVMISRRVPPCAAVYTWWTWRAANACGGPRPGACPGRRRGPWEFKMWGDMYINKNINMFCPTYIYIYIICFIVIFIAIIIIMYIYILLIFIYTYMCSFASAIYATMC